jgi:protein-S-isoprenylcysteine O-methyltransferase Ste14
MRSILLIAAAIIAFGATITVTPREASAVACARGVYRAGCVGPRGAAVVRHPPARVCRSVLVNGVYVRRCY